MSCRLLLVLGLSLSTMASASIADPVIPPDGTSSATEPSGDARLSFASANAGDGVTAGPANIRFRIPTWILGNRSVASFCPTANVSREGWVTGTSDGSPCVTWIDGSVALSSDSEELTPEPRADILSVTVQREDALNLVAEFTLRGAPVFSGSDYGQYFLLFFATAQRDDARLLERIEVRISSSTTQLSVSRIDRADRVAPFSDLLGYSAQTTAGRLFLTVNTAAAIPDNPDEELGEPYYAIAVGNTRRMLFFEYVRALGVWRAGLRETLAGQFRNTPLPVPVNSSRSGDSFSLDVALSDLGLKTPYISLAVSAMSAFDEPGLTLFSPLDRFPNTGALSHTCQCTGCSATVPSTGYVDIPVPLVAAYTSIDPPELCPVTFNWRIFTLSSTWGTTTGISASCTFQYSNWYRWTLQVVSPAGTVFETTDLIYVERTPPVVGGVRATPAAEGDAVVIDVRWNALRGVDRYEVWRASPRNLWELRATVDAPSASYRDVTVEPARAYLYKVRAAVGATCPFSNVDYATAILLPHPLLVRTVAGAENFLRLRQSVSALRILAELPPVSFTDVDLAGATIKADHVLEVRTALSEALGALGFPVSFAQTIAPGDSVKAQPVGELFDYTR